MLIKGCDYHPSVQQIPWVDTKTEECWERRLRHRAEAEQFYRELKGKQVRVAIEATGRSRWFERLLSEIAIVHQPTLRNAANFYPFIDLPCSQS